MRIRARITRYTLMEMVAVIAILAVVFSMATVSFSSLRLEKSPVEQAESLRRLGVLCRRSAIAQGKDFTIEWTHEKRIFGFGTEALRIPEEMEVKVNDQILAKDQEVMRFFPDGNAGEVTVVFTRDEESAIVRVSPLTGLMEIYETE